MSNLKKKYFEEIVPILKKRYPDRNIMSLAKLKKIVINMGIAQALKDKGAISDHTKELADLSGQRPIITKAKKSISNFKLRRGQAIGLKVTLRGDRMYDFLCRFINIAAPRIRDFRGFLRKCDGRGCYTLGLEDQQAFVEINLDAVKRAQGMNITFVTSARNNEECIELLLLFGFPFKSEVK